MGIISQVGRKKAEIRVLIASIYGLLVLGALSMLVPLAIMMTLSVSSVTDLKEVALFPRYLFSGERLYRKHLAARYSENLIWVKQNYPVQGQDWLNWERVSPGLAQWTPEQQEGMEKLAADWDEFVLGLPLHFYNVGYATNQSNGPGQVAFQAYLEEKYGSSEEFNRQCNMNVIYLSTVNYPDDAIMAHVNFFEETQVHRDFWDFKKGIAPDLRVAAPAGPLYQTWLKFKYQDKIAELNKAWGTAYKDAYFADLPFPLSRPSHPAQAADYDEFLRARFPRGWITVAKDHGPAYRAFLKKRFPTVQEFNEACGAAIKGWDELSFPHTAPRRAEVKAWSEFINTLPLSEWTLDFAELRYRKFVEGKHGSLEKAAKAYGVALASPKDNGLILPMRHADEVYFKANRGAILWHHLTHNYVMVSRYLFQQSRAAANTFILVALSIITALVVNPVAAYALSRFRLSYTPKVLLFLLATAAFPAEVTALPQFLLIKKFGMLNTFAALILPGLVNGFWIFMLKGFFDSLPKELYEAAIIEGANEVTIFTRITVPLAAPILALTAFGAFNAAYGGYLWNIIVANDTSMWTIMVTLQQYMNGNPTNLVMAAMVLASLPTLIAFLLVQRAILKGIVIPTMH